MVEEITNLIQDLKKEIEEDEQNHYITYDDLWKDWTKDRLTPELELVMERIYLRKDFISKLELAEKILNNTELYLENKFDSIDSNEVKFAFCEMLEDIAFEYREKLKKQ